MYFIVVYCYLLFFAQDKFKINKNENILIEKIIKMLCNALLLVKEEEV